MSRRCNVASSGRRSGVIRIRQDGPQRRSPCFNCCTACCSRRTDNGYVSVGTILTIILVVVLLMIIF
jgi:hypothetical protein